MLNSLLDVWKVEYTPPKPRLEEELVTCLVAWALPKHTEQEVKDIVATRCQPRELKFSTVLSTETVDMLAKSGDIGGEGHDEIHLITKEVEAIEAAKKPLRVPAVTISSSSGGPTPLVAPPASLELRTWLAKIPIENKIYEVEEARKMLPDCKGCVLSINKNVAWEVKYPRACPPRSRSISFTPGDLETHRAALRGVLLWAWRAHKEASPDAVCTLDLGEAV